MNTTKLVKSFAKTIIISENAKISVAKKLITAIEKEPQRAKELKQTAVLLKIEHLVFPLTSKPV